MSEASNGLIDIIEPAAPPVLAADGGLWIAALIAGLLVLAGGLLVWWKYRLPAYRSVKELRKLRHRLQLKELTPHESMLMLALELRHGLGVKRLRADQLPPQLKSQDHARWAEFMQQLDVVLYQHAAELGEDRLQALFEQAKYWLGRYSRRSSLKKFGA